MYPASISLNLVLVVLRVFLGAMIFAHGYNKVFRGGRIDGTASWFASIGMRRGRVNAWLAAGSEMGVGALLVAGLLTPLAAGGLIGIMTVAIVTVHARNGFFVFNRGQGMEYCLCVIAASLVVATLGPGRFSVDYLTRHVGGADWLARPSHGLLVAVIVGLGGSLAQLLVFYRPDPSPPG
jgi:putative oxidoreductase